MNAQKADFSKEKLHEIIFEAETPAGKLFDIILLITIAASVLVVMLESVHSLDERFQNLFYILEWVFTIIFTIEYILRLYCVYKPIKYATSFFGVIDLLAILPTFLSIFIAGTQSLLVIRALRLLRVFRIFKMFEFLDSGNSLLKALKSSSYKISIFTFFIILLVCIFGSIMYLVEGAVNNKFDSIPRSIYWAIVTLTTVGYGDISPITPLGQALSAVVMLMGYAIIAVPTGIVTSEIFREHRNLSPSHSCMYCSTEGHDLDAKYCKYCGEPMNKPPK